MHKIYLAPTTLPDTPPLEYVAAAVSAGYDGMALRVHPSPGLPFHPIVGNAPLIGDLKRALADAPPVQEIGSYYLQPDTRISAFEEMLRLGAEFGAKTAFVIGDDTDFNRLCDKFGAFCDLAAGFGLSAFVEFVPQRPLGTLAATLDLFAQALRANVAVCIDPLNFARSGGKIAELTAIDRRFLPYAQFSDGIVHDDEPVPSPRMRPNVRRLPGEGNVPIAEILSALPANIPLSVEFPRSLSAHLPGATGEMAAADWAKFVLMRSRQFLAHIGVATR